VLSQSYLNIPDLIPRMFQDFHSRLACENAIRLIRKYYQFFLVEGLLSKGPVGILSLLSVESIKNDDAETD
jgi:hypothetical protein